MRLQNCDTKKEYEISKTIYENSTTKIWCGICKSETETYFAKILNYGEIEDKTFSDEMLEIMKSEANTLKKVMECSRRVPGIRDSWNDKKKRQFFVIMDKMPGKSLRQWMDNHMSEQLSAKELFVRICLVVQICEIMRDISRRYPVIVHRDLKPENILIDFDKNQKRWKVYIIDFGCANLNHLRNVGTTHYQAPEQIGIRNVGVAINMKTDLFAIGQIMYELLTGKAPHIGEDYTYKARGEQWIKTPEIPAYLTAIKGMDSILRVLTKMTSLKPEDRPTYDRVITELKNTRLG